MHKSTVGGLLLLACAHVAAGERLTFGDFSAASLSGWESESFEGETEYDFVKIDGRTALRARCDASASGLVFQQQIDLTKTPVLHWSWRVDEVYPGLEEKTQAGDDYPARIYVIHDGGWLKWRSRAINYVWSSAQPAGETWPNAFVSQAMMVAVQSGPPAQTGRWSKESRDVRADFKRIFGLELDDVDAVALMTDCDNSGRTGTAYYGDIYFTPAAE
jgi:hypothetical protein